jgi:hypothetical protein
VDARGGLKRIALAVVIVFVIVLAFAPSVAGQALA